MRIKDSFIALIKRFKSPANSFPYLLKAGFFPRALPVPQLLGQEGFGAAYNPHRSQALQRVALAASLEQVEEEIAKENGGPPVLVATSARITPDTTGYREMRKIMKERGGAYLLLFGTGWGMTDEVMQKASYTLRPVYGRGGYNHLSVRSAASIVLDRLLGEKFSP